MIHTINKRIKKGKYVVRETFTTDVNFKSMKTYRMELYYCSSPKKNDIVFTVQLTGKASTEEESKVILKQLDAMFNERLLTYMMTDEFKEMLND